jgi:hypothetical protein
LENKVLPLQSKLFNMTIDESLINAEEAIKPYLSIFKDCYGKAIKKYNSVLDNFSQPMYNRTKAVNFQNIIVNLIKEALTDYENVVIKEKYESITVVINNHTCARFKKLNAKGFPSNVRTVRNSAIESQQLQIGYIDMPPIARVDVGYKLDATGTDYEMLKVICRKGKKIIWDLYFHDINDKGETGGIEVTGTPIAPVETEIGRIKFPKENKKAK